MRILLLTHAYNSLTQCLHLALQERGHQVSIEFDISDGVTQEALELFVPDLIIAPYLRRAIPESVWSRCVCLIVHPGVVGDRGPSALDWAICSGVPEWGVTVLQAQAELDAGPVWAYDYFTMPQAKKSSVYRNEVTRSALAAVLHAVDRFETGAQPQDANVVAKSPSYWRGAMPQSARSINWQIDDAAAVLRKIQSADGFPGVLDSLFDEPCHVFDAWLETQLRGPAGAVLGRRETAVLRATHDAAVWIGHVKRTGSIKLPSTLAFAPETACLPDLPLDGWWMNSHPTWQDIAYVEQEQVGLLYFEFYNGAMSTRQCERLHAALCWAKQRPIRVLVLMGGRDFWSNGIHLSVIEAAALGSGSAADESWSNIQAMNDLALELISCEAQLTVAALGGNAGAGGCFLARAADRVWVRDGVLLNPHYKNMGNLYGSEYWTYLLPRRVGADAAESIRRNRLPLTARQALHIGFTDDCIAGDLEMFHSEVIRRAVNWAATPDLPAQLAIKSEARAADERARPLASYRAQEMEQMQRNFYGFDPSYHIARHHFVRKSPVSWTPRHLAVHRDLGWCKP